MHIPTNPVIGHVAEQRFNPHITLQKEISHLDSSEGPDR